MATLRSLHGAFFLAAVTHHACGTPLRSFDAVATPSLEAQATPKHIVTTPGLITTPALEAQATPETVKEPTDASNPESVTADPEPLAASSVEIKLTVDDFKPLAEGFLGELAAKGGKLFANLLRRFASKSQELSEVLLSEASKRCDSPLSPPNVKSACTLLSKLDEEVGLRDQFDGLLQEVADKSEKAALRMEKPKEAEQAASAIVEEVFKRFASKSNVTEATKSS